MKIFGSFCNAKHHNVETGFELFCITSLFSDQLVRILNAMRMRHSSITFEGDNAGAEHLVPTIHFRAFSGLQRFLKVRGFYFESRKKSTF